MTRYLKFKNIKSKLRFKEGIFKIINDDTFELEGHKYFFSNTGIPFVSSSFLNTQEGKEIFTIIEFDNNGKRI